jgi:putative intracellular protease/amidase
MAIVLMLLPASDYDPSESALPWAALVDAGHEVRFATPTGAVAGADPRLVDVGFGLLSPILMTRKDALASYQRMTQDAHFRAPLTHAAARPADFDALLVPGGHAPGMRTLLDSQAAQRFVGDFFALERPVGAICHGVLLLARSVSPATGRSVLHGRRTTALTGRLELSAWLLTALWLGRYYRTYPRTVQAEVTRALRAPTDFAVGPLLPRRDSAAHPERGFVVRDGHYLSARWPGDCHRFARELLALLAEARATEASTAPGRAQATKG